LTVAKHRFRADGVAWPATSTFGRGRQRRTVWVTLIIPTSRPPDPKGDKLAQPMPQWHLTDQEWGALLADLKTLH